MYDDVGEEAAVIESSNAQESKKATYDPSKYKTVLCKMFLVGNCKYGTSCNFAHGEDELSQRDKMTNEDLQKKFVDSKYKTVICSAWREGNCKFGEKCRFAHGEEDLASNQMRRQGVKRKNPWTEQGLHCPVVKRSRYGNSGLEAQVPSEISVAEIIEENDYLKKEVIRLQAQVDILLKAVGPIQDSGVARQPRYDSDYRRRTLKQSRY